MHLNKFGSFTMSQGQNPIQMLPAKICHFVLDMVKSFLGLGERDKSGGNREKAKIIANVGHGA